MFKIFYCLTIINAFFVSFSGPTPTKYLIYYSNLDSPSTPTENIQSAAETISIRTLSPNTRYEFYVVPYNKDAAGPKSVIVKTKTPSEGIA